MTQENNNFNDGSSGDNIQVNKEDESNLLSLEDSVPSADLESPYTKSPIVAKLEEMKSAIKTVLVGQDDIVDKLLLSVLANGHVLIEGVPGLAKTLLARLIARTMDGSFHRIQFTPDLMPSDIIGTMVFDPSTADFDYKKGPLFAQIVLIDEINRAPAKTQAALFEAMEERQVTMDATTHSLPLPFIVLATQNPVEHEGTYRLPEAQLDRFLMKIVMGYPEFDEEMEILSRENRRKSDEKADNINPVLTISDILELQSLTRSVSVENSVMQYMARIVVNTRQHPFLYMGASPRASVALLNTSKARALTLGRDFVIPDDVIYVAESVLVHRIILLPEREMEGMTPSQVIHQILEKIEIPR